MADIELKLIANNQQYIAGIKEAQLAEQSMNDSFKAGEKDKQALINSTVSAMSNEEKALQIISTGVTKTSGSLKAQLAQIRTALSQMEQQGLTGTKAFMQLSIRAGELADQAGDTAQQIKILSSDTKNLDAAMSVGTGLAGGFALAQGSMALFGNESENMQKQLVKLQGGLNVLNGMQQVANVLNKDSAARVVINAKAQELYARVVGNSTGAMKVFRVAMAAMGIGLLIAAIGLLVANWDKLSKSIGNAITGQGEMNKKIEEQKKLIDNLTISTKLMNDQRDREAALLEAQGDNEEKVAKLKEENALKNAELKRQEIQLTEDEIEKQKILLKTIASNTASNSWLGNVKNFVAILSGNGPKSAIEKIDELNKKLITQGEEYKDLTNQAKVLSVTEEKRVKDIKKKDVEKALEEQKQKLKEFTDLLKQLADKETAAKLSLLSGKAKIDTEEKLQLEEVDMLKKHLQKLGTLNKTQLGQIETLKTSISRNAQKERDKIDQGWLDDMKARRDNITDLERQIQEDQLELIGAGEVEKLKLKQSFLKQDLEVLKLRGGMEAELTQKNIQQQIDIIQKEIDKQDKGSFSIWKLIGIDPNSDQGKAAIDSLKESTSIILDQVGQIMDAEVQQAEQHTQLIEQRLSEAESQLDKEKDLQEKGLANNVDAKQKEVAQLKIEREKALEEEKKAKEEQMLLDTAMQASSLITATANIIKGFSKIPLIGQILSVAAIALMFSTFAAAKIKASQAISAKAEYGAYGDDTGIVVGKRHAQGGEKFTDHIEVEQGEAWGVFNRQATQKFGKLIPYIVDSMNNLQFPNLSIKGNHTTVNVDTKKMQSKLESIDFGIKVLNENMVNSEDMFYSGKTKVIKIAKNHTRIIHAAN